MRKYVRSSEQTFNETNVIKLKIIRNNKMKIHTHTRTHNTHVVRRRRYLSYPPRHLWRVICVIFRLGKHIVNFNWRSHDALRVDAPTGKTEYLNTENERGEVTTRVKRPTAIYSRSSADWNIFSDERKWDFIIPKMETSVFFLFLFR